MKVPVYNFAREQVGEVDLPEAIFARRWNSDLVHQVLSAIQANRRQPTAHAKTRAEVSGGGRKPWRQKGTGRARHGSIRSPLWKGGGVAHGPTPERRFTVRLNKKMRSAALAATLSRKLAEHQLRVLDSLEPPAAKTNALDQNLRSFLNIPKRGITLSTLLIPSRAHRGVFRICANIPAVKGVGANAVSVEDLLAYRHVLIEKDAVGEFTAKRAGVVTP